ncbi:MAG: M23 family metallopeptidase [Acidobacteriota bacterium]
MERERRKKNSLRRFLAVLILLVLVFCGLAMFRVGGEPSVSMTPEMPGIGRATPVTVRLAEPRRGLYRARVELVQEDRTFPVTEKTWRPQPAWKPWGAKTAEDLLAFEVGGDTVEELKSGRASLRVIAERADSWLRRPQPVVAEMTLPVRLSPPTIGVISSQHNVQQGGSGVVVYRLGEGATESGVAAGERWFPGFPLPGGGGDYFALYGLPYDLDDSMAVTLVVQDDVGNRAERRFLDTFAPKPVAQGTIRLSDDFMTRVVPEILAKTPSVRAGETVLDSYLAINGELRKENRRWLVELAAESAKEFLWSEPFLPMKNAQVMSPFAVRRTYTYNGEPVDTQYHLGFDLASVRRAPIEAANAGVVVAARFVGIYGNVVVVDHGYGLMTLYAHLSSTEVEEGERVERGQVLGRSGETGLAGGDHLHFGILIQGMPVTPVEWWDRQWIRDRFAAKLGEAFSYQD